MGESTLLLVWHGPGSAHTPHAAQQPFWRMPSAITSFGPSSACLLTLSHTTNPPPCSHPRLPPCSFVRKVLGLLTTQLLVTAAVSWTFVAIPEVKGFVGAHPWVLWTSIGLAFALILVLACSESARRSHPTNLILLMLFTGFEAVLVGSACAVYNAQVVLLALAITGAVVLGLVLFTLQTHVDLTSIGGVLYSLLWTLLVAGIVQAFVHAPWLHIAICAGGAALFSC